VNAVTEQAGPGNLLAESPEQRDAPALDQDGLAGVVVVPESAEVGGEGFIPTAVRRYKGNRRPGVERRSNGSSWSLGMCIRPAISPFAV
jgi:hypothetical protein